MEDKFTWEMGDIHSATYEEVQKKYAEIREQIKKRQEEDGNRDTLRKQHSDGEV